jgi:hypothetical protein
VQHLGLAAAAATQERTEPRQQFVEREGLGQAVIGPSVEAPHASDTAGSVSTTRMRTPSAWTVKLRDR